MLSNNLSGWFTNQFGDLGLDEGLADGVDLADVRWRVDHVDLLQSDWNGLLEDEKKRLARKKIKTFSFLKTVDTAVDL